MASVLHHVTALAASRHLGATTERLEQALARFEDLRGHPEDESAIDSQPGPVPVDELRLAGQGKRNAEDGMAYLQAADAALEEVANLLGRAEEVAAQATTEPRGSEASGSLEQEFQAIVAGIADRGLNTRFNGQNVFDSQTPLTVAVGNGPPVTVRVDCFATSPSTALGLDATRDTPGSVREAALREARGQVDAQRAQIGAAWTELGTLAHALAIQIENIAATRSRVRDAGIVNEIIQLTKFRVLQESGPSTFKRRNAG